MSRITGTVSRTIPLAPVIGRSLSLSGTFDLYVSPTELAAIGPTLDSLAASGILTASNRYFDDGSLIAAQAAPLIDAVVAATAQPGAALILGPFAIPDAVTQTYAYVTGRKIEIIDAKVIKSTAGAGNTIKIQDVTPSDITDAMAAAVDKVVTRAGTIDRTKSTIAAGGIVNILATKNAGSMAAEVYLEVILR